MVRYRPEAGERGYTFRLNNHGSSAADGGNGISPTGTLLSEHSTSTMGSSVYKERIDSLFRYNMMQQHRKNPAPPPPPPEEEEPAADEEPTMEHLQLHFQKVLTEQRHHHHHHHQRGPPPTAATSTFGSSKNHSTTYIQVRGSLRSMMESLLLVLFLD